MKIYVFEHGHIEGELNAEQIREAEKTKGALKWMSIDCKLIGAGIEGYDSLGRKLNFTEKRIEATKKNFAKSPRGKKEKA